MHSEHAEQSRLPQPPSIERRFSLYRYQWIAVPLLFLVPVVALFGTFDLTLMSVRAQADGLAVTVTYPVRVRYRQDAMLEVVLRNTGAMPVDSVRVDLDTAYLGAFSRSDFTPQLDDRHAVVLLDVAPGESRLIRGQLKAERYWSHAGVVRVRASTSEQAVDVPLHTLILP